MRHFGWFSNNVGDVLWKMPRCVFQYRMMRLFCTFYVHSVMEVRFIRLSLCTKSKRLRVLLKDVCLLWVLLKRRIELYPLRCPFSAFRIFWTAHWDRKCRSSTFRCLGWTFSFCDVLTSELQLQWLQQPKFNRHELWKLDWKKGTRREYELKKKGGISTGIKSDAVLDLILFFYCLNRPDIGFVCVL